MENIQLNNIEFISKIGQGSYASVYHAKLKTSGRGLAVKLIPSTGRGKDLSALREIKYDTILPDHYHLAKLEAKFTNVPQANGSKVHCLVYDLMECDLSFFIRSYQSNGLLIEPFQVRDLMWQLVLAVEVIHHHNVMHRDLKPENLLLNSVVNPRLKMTDFGIAGEIVSSEAGRSSEVAALAYRAPELLLGCTQYGGEIDMWSVGCIFAELISGEHLFGIVNPDNALDEVFKIVGTPTMVSWPEAAFLPKWPGIVEEHPVNFPEQLHRCGPLAFDLLTSLLTSNPRNRITAIEAMNHVYFAPCHIEFYKSVNLPGCRTIMD